MNTYTQSLVEGDEIVLLIPQRAPFVMVDKLLHNDELKTVSAFKVRPDNIFLTDGILHEPALIENIAQTAALRIGYPLYLDYKEGKEPSAQLGFIGAISKLKVYDLPPEGTEIVTTVLFEKEVMDVILISGRVTLGEKTLVECEMKIFIKKD